MTVEPPVLGHGVAHPDWACPPARASAAVLLRGSLLLSAEVPRPAASLDNESGLPLGTGLAVGALGLVLSLGLTLWSRASADDTQQVDHQLRLSLVITLAFYVLLGLALGGFCVQRRVGLTWTRGSVVEALLWGFPLGAAGGGLAVLLNSALSGRLASDPRVELLVGGGGFLRISLTFLVTAVLAPLVEETLFRGVLAGTLISRGAAPAVWVSAIAFSVWHMNATSLRYYVFMGLLLATLWRKRGLVASMSAHAAFNGVLTLAAIAATTSGGHLVTYQALTFQLPGGWHQTPVSRIPGGLTVEGPGGAALVATSRPGAVPTLAQMQDTLVRAERGGSRHTVVAGTERPLPLPIGYAVTADVLLTGQPGHVVDVVMGGTEYELLVVTGGSPAAEAGWTRILSTMTGR